MKLKDIKKLIELVSEKGFAEFEIEEKGFRLKLRRFSETALPPSAGPFIISSSLPSSDIAVRRSEQRVLEAQLPNSAEQQAAESDAPAPQAAAAPAEPEVQLHTIKSPIVGTFYRAASPTSDSFVKIGDRVEPDSVVCIIEAMKLMNEIQAEVAGEVVQIYVENGQPVEYGQPLFGLKL
jgi:acetyl-CoA carboxylase biotin carboxyl carrier protein